MKAPAGAFGSQSYWKAQYVGARAGQAAVSEWFADAEAVLEPVVDFLKRKQVKKCAHLGSGLSSLGIRVAASMSDIQVTNIDTSAESLELLAQKMTGREQALAHRVHYVRDDLLNPRHIQASAFDACLDKGTLDAIEFSAQGSVQVYLDTVQKILRPGGWFLQISDRPPESRDDLLMSCHFTNASFRELDDALFLYRLEKKKIEP